MGLIKAAIGAIGGNLADQWKEVFYAEALDKDTLMIKGEKMVNGNRTSNVHGNENVISNGSGVIVNDGQCMIIVEQGKVVDICADPGQFTYDNTVAPTLFTGSLGQAVKDTFANIGKRFTMGGDTGVDQRVYYFNIKEILGNKYGTTDPVPFRVVDTNIGLDIDTSVRCNGEYSYKIVDPILFYTNVVGNVAESYTRDQIESQLRTELLTALQPAFAEISAQGVRYSAIPAHAKDVAAELNKQLSDQWRGLRGLEIVSFGINSITLSEEDRKKIEDLQAAATLKDPNMAAAVVANAQADAMRAAASNESAGAFAAFAGMGMAGAAGGANAGNLFQQGGGGAQPNMGPTAANGGFAAAAPAAGAAAGTWTCSCGTANTGKFCSNCGQPKPAPAAPAGQWTCTCGAVNTGKFCSNCGAAAPAAPAAGAAPAAPAGTPPVPPAGGPAGQPPVQ